MSAPPPAKAPTKTTLKKLGVKGPPPRKGPPGAKGPQGNFAKGRGATLKRVPAKAKAKGAGFKSLRPLKKISTDFKRSKTPPSGMGRAPPKAPSSSSANLVKKPLPVAKSAPAISAPPPAVPAFEPEEAPPPVPEFVDEPPAVPAFDEEVEEGGPVDDSMLDSVFDQIVAGPPKEEDTGSGSMLDSVFDEIHGGGPAPEKAAPTQEAGEDDLLDSVFASITGGGVGPKPKASQAPIAAEGEGDGLLDSVLNSIRGSSSVGAAASSEDPLADVIAEQAGDDDLMGAVLSQIKSQEEGGNRASDAETTLHLLETESASSRTSEAASSKRDSMTASDIGVEAPAVRAVAGPAGPPPKVGGLRPVQGPQGPAASPIISRRPRVKSVFNASSPSVGSVDIGTIRVGKNSSGEVAPAKQEVKVRSFLNTNRRKGKEIESQVLYDLGLQNPPSALRLWNDKAVIVVAGDKVILRTLQSEEKLGDIPEPGIKISLVDEHNGRLWLAAKDSHIKVYDLVKGKLDKPSFNLTSHSEWVADLAIYSPQLVLSASADRSIRVWNLPSQKSPSVMKGHVDFVTCIITIPNPNVVDDDAPPLLASGSCDKTVRIWDPVTARCFHTIYGHTGWVWSLCSDAKGSLWSSGRDNKLCNWNTKTGTLIKEVKLESSVTKLLMHDKTMFAIDESLVISMYRKGKLFKKLSGHSGKIKALAFLGRHMFTAGDDKVIRQWDARGGSLQAVLKGHRDSVTDLRGVEGTGKLYSCSDDGTVREWNIGGTAGGAINKAGAVDPRDVEIAKLRALMADPFYRAVAKCQAIVRMRFVYESVQVHKDLMKSAKARYLGICNMVSFEQNLLGNISQFLSGFLVPLRAYIQKHGEAAELLKTSDKHLSGFADTLYAVFVFHSNLMEKLETHKDDYPFCVDSGYILQSDLSVAQLYLLLMEYIPFLEELSTVNQDTNKASILEKIEQEQNVRLDHGAVRTLLWAFSKYWEQARLPLIQILRFTPSNLVSNDAPLLCAALARLTGMEIMVRVTTGLLMMRQKFLRLAQRLVPSDVGILEKELLDDPGKLIFERVCVQKARLKKDQMKLVLTSKFLLIVTDTGNSKKDRIVDKIDLENVAQVILQADAKEVLVQLLEGSKHVSIGTNSPQIGGGRKKPSGQEGKYLFMFENAQKAQSCQAGIHKAWLLARFGTTFLPLADQIIECNKLGGSTRFLPDYPVILIQYLAEVDDETVSTVFNIPPSELKVASIAQAYDTVEDRAQRANALAKVIPAAGVQNVFAALLDYFVFLRKVLLTSEQRKAIMAAESAQTLRKIFAGVAEESKDLLGYFLWFLGEKFVPAMNRSEFEDPEMVVAAVVAPVIFWDSNDMRRMLNEIPRAFAAGRNLLSWYREIFVDRKIAPLVKFGESQASVELRKRQAKQKYEAEEQQRARAADEKERALAKKKLQQGVGTSQADDMRSKQELEQLVSEQMADFKHKKEEAEKDVRKGQSQFELLQKQQQEAKARAEARRKLQKERSLRSSSDKANASNSEASLDSFLDKLETSSPDARKSRMRRGSKIVESRASSSGALRTSSVGAFAGTVPMIKIPELKLTPGQQKMLILIPPLPH